MAPPIKAVIVDDEALARDAIRLRLCAEPDIQIVAEAANGAAAIEAVRRLEPDLLFLDIHMPGMDGFEVVERVASEHLPIVVFVTAHDRYAIRAFEAHALDYLLKPFTEGRFRAAVDRARLEVAKASEHETHQPLIQVLDDRRRARERRSSRENGGYAARLAVKHNQRIVLVKTADVNWVESSANYAELHTAAGSYLVRMTMNELESRLDPQRFARIHRSTIVQLDRIKDIVPAWHGDFDVTLSDGSVLRLSRNYRDRVFLRRRRR